MHLSSRLETPTQLMLISVESVIGDGSQSRM